MNFESICGVFSAEQRFWPCPNASLALPFFFKASVQQRFGGAFAANDVHSRTTPRRDGVWTRRFQAGDPFHSLSKTHLMKTNEFLTRVDDSAGRQRAVVVFHSYVNLLYQSWSCKINKGQLANGVVGILEQAHRSVTHFFKVLSFQTNNLFAECHFFSKDLRSADYVYFITDLLFDSCDMFAAAQQACDVIEHFHFKKVIFIIVRDPFELPLFKQESVAMDSCDELIPWQESPHGQKIKHFSGEVYFENLRQQIDFFTKKVEEKHHLVTVLNAWDKVIPFVNFVVEKVLGKTKKCF
jgi:hypothetical protein